MNGKFNFKLGALCAVLSLFLVAPALVQAKGEMEEHIKKLKVKIVKQMKLAPDKEKAFMEVDDKYATERQKIIADLKKSQADLKTALKESKPDESKVKDLVSAITDGQDKLFATFKNQRDEELGLLSPVEQGKYLLAMSDWRHKAMEKCMKDEAGKKNK
jgi:hypothetical protein